MSKTTDKDSASTFCPLAWVHRFTNIGGEIQICCSSEERDNNIRSNSGKMMNIRDAFTDAEILNSEYMKKLRLQMLQGEWPEPCERCRITEQTGGTSRRVNENIRYGADREELIATTSSDGTIPIAVESADYRLGNLCNLACRMCNPRSSSKWINAWDDVDQDLFILNDNSKKEYHGYDWYQTPHFKEEFLSQLPSLTHLHFAGGEPLIVPEMAMLLRACVETGRAAHIDLTYNTNITKISKEIKSLWPHFKHVRLFASIDGYGAVNEYIRYPSKWSMIDANLRDLDENFAAYGLTEVIVMTTVQVYNILSLEPLFDYLAPMKNIDQIPRLVDLHYPGYYRTQILTPELKVLAKTRLEALFAKSHQRIEDGIVRRNQEGALGSLRSAIEFLNLEDHVEQIPDFLRAALSKDDFRKQSLFKVIPELEDLWLTNENMANTRLDRAVEAAAEF